MVKNGKQEFLNDGISYQQDRFSFSLYILQSLLHHKLENHRMLNDAHDDVRKRLVEESWEEKYVKLKKDYLLEKCSFLSFPYRFSLSKVVATTRKQRNSPFRWH